MRAAIVINPISGRGGRRAGEGERRADLARELAARAGVPAEVVVTAARGDAVRFAREFAARGAEVVVAWGGDGTVNEVATPLIGTTTSLGVVPSGSGDGLAHSLRLPLETRAALNAALTSSATAIDVGYLNDRPFLNIAGIGFDAAVGAAFQSSKRGGLGYLTRGMRLVWGYQAEMYELELDGVMSRGRRFLVGFANGREYGNNAVLAPAADLTDGWLDVAMVEAGGSWQQIWRARRLFFRRHAAAVGVLRTRIRSGSVSASRLICHVDGETFVESGTVRVRLAPLALQVRGVPKRV